MRTEIRYPGRARDSPAWFGADAQGVQQVVRALALPPPRVAPGLGADRGSGDGIESRSGGTAGRRRGRAARPRVGALEGSFPLPGHRHEPSWGAVPPFRTVRLEAWTPPVPQPLIPRALTGVDNPTSLHCRSPRASGKGPRRTECGSQSGRTKSTVSGGAAYSRAVLAPEVPPRRAHMLRGQGRSVCEHRGQAEALGQAPQRGNQWGSGTGRDESWQERAAVAPEPPRPLQQRFVALRPRKSARQYQRKP